MPLGSRSRSRTKCPLYPLLSCQSSSVAPQMPHEFGEWFSVRSPVSASQRHFPLAPGCLPGLRGGADGGVHGLAAAEPLTSSFWPPSPLDGSPPKGLSDDGVFEEFVEFLASRSASSTVIACNRHRSSRRAPELSPSKKARFIAERLTGGLFDMPAKESDSRLPRQHFSPETAQSSQYTAPPRIRDCERFLNDDVVISHDDIVPDRRIVVLRLASPRADSKCRGLIAKSIADNSPRLDSTVAMTCHRSSPSSAAAPILPPIVISLMAPFRSFFTAPVWEHVLVLVTGMMLAPGKRTVSAVLRVMGLGETRDFALYHYVLSRARCSSRGIARMLLPCVIQ